MTTINNRYQYMNGDISIDCKVFCKSTDEKPTAGIPNGATLTEIDTGNMYLFDAEASQWVFQLCLQG